MMTAPDNPKEDAAMLRVSILGLAVLTTISAPIVAHAELGTCCYEDGSCEFVEEEDCSGCLFFPGEP
jgi:hypothetical protein